MCRWDVQYRDEVRHGFGKVRDRSLPDERVASAVSRQVDVDDTEAVQQVRCQEVEVVMSRADPVHLDERRPAARLAVGHAPPRGQLNLTKAHAISVPCGGTRVDPAAVGLSFCYSESGSGTSRSSGLA